MKRTLNDDTECSARRAYNWTMNQLPIDEAAVAAPLSSVERSLQRHKVRNHPQLPQTREDLVLEPEHTVTADGGRFVLIDDGMADRILVFGTDRNLNRLALGIVVLV